MQIVNINLHIADEVLAQMRREAQLVHISLDTLVSQLLTHYYTDNDGPVDLDADTLLSMTKPITKPITAADVLDKRPTAPDDTQPPAQPATQLPTDPNDTN